MTGAHLAHLELRGVEAHYAGTPVLHGVDLVVPPGTISGIVGESGSGKTTLARVIAGRAATSAGDVLIDGERLTGQRTVAQRRAIQTIYQDPYSSLNPRMRVRQVLTEVLTVHHLVPADRREARVGELLAEVGLPPEAARRRPAAFSGGQRQRIAIARALAAQPRLVIADEPTSALDVAVQETILQLFATLRDRLGLTLVLISHDLALIARLCDHVTVLDHGRAVESGSIDDVLRNPQHQTTRALLAAVPRLPPRGETR